MIRVLTVVLLVAGGWAGMKAERLLAADRCRGAGGTVNAQGICIGARGP
jgi:hypothetical protein